MALTTPRSDPHVQAVLALLTAALPPSIAVFDGQVPGAAPYPYIVVYPDGGTATAPAADGAFVDLTMTVQITAVGTTRQEAAGAADFARAALIGQSPAVPGRYCWPIEQVLTRPVARDDDARAATNQSVFTAIDQYQLMSVPA